MNNFKLIAENFAGIYYALKKYNRYTTDELLFLSVAINFTEYIKRDAITMEDIKDATKLAHINACSVFPVMQHHANLFNIEQTETDMIVNMIMQAECLMLRADSPLSASNIVHAVIMNKKRIQKAVQKVFDMKKNVGFYQSMDAFIRMVFTRPEFNNMILPKLDTLKM